TNWDTNENMANVQEENQEGAKVMESTPIVEQEAEADSTLVGESVVMMETEVGKQDSVAEIATYKVINENLVNVEGKQEQEKAVKLTQSPV
ncbi:hypothetical protein Droror1_Dr00026917, partial [Drosera rotundifolia]